MSFDLVEIWGHMGLLNRLISISLIIMGLASLTVFFERLWALGKNKARAQKQAAAVADLLAQGKFAEALAAVEDQKGAYFGSMLQATVGQALMEREGELTGLERAQRELARWQEAFGAQMRRGMNIIATTGSIAPFVGLLGTVVGIIVAFKSISMTGSGGISSVAGGISEALVETALGLLVAIPAVALFNFISARIDAFETHVTQNGSKILDLLEDYGYGHTDRNK